jgi:hypothetical protein
MIAVKTPGQQLGVLQPARPENAAGLLRVLVHLLRVQAQREPLLRRCCC